MKDLAVRLLDGTRALGVSRLLRPLPEGNQRAQADRAKQDGEGDAQHKKTLASPLAHDNAPLAAEQPDAVSQIPAGRHQADNVKSKNPRMAERLLHLAKAGAGQIVEIDAGESLGVGVIDDEHEGDAAGPALQAVHPISRPGIAHQIGLAAIPEPNAVSAVEGERQPNAK